MSQKYFVVVGIIALALIVGACAAPPSPAPAAQAAPPSGVLIASHAAGFVHEAKPKRLEAFAELDMNEHFMSNPKGEKNPIFRLPVGKTVGLHIHNEGKELHEIVIGRGAIKYEVQPDGKKVAVGYEKSLFDEVDADLFFYYGDDKAEVGEAKFAELEVPPGVKQIWMRFKVPAELKGEWEIGCFAEDHYEQGMKAKLILE